MKKNKDDEEIKEWIDICIPGLGSDVYAQIGHKLYPSGVEEIDGVYEDPDTGEMKSFKTLNISSLMHDGNNGERKED